MVRHQHGPVRYDPTRQHGSLCFGLGIARPQQSLPMAGWGDRKHQRGIVGLGRLGAARRPQHPDIRIAEIHMIAPCQPTHPSASSPDTGDQPPKLCPGMIGRHVCKPQFADTPFLGEQAASTSHVIRLVMGQHQHIDMHQAHGTQSGGEFGASVEQTGCRPRHVHRYDLSIRRQQAGRCPLSDIPYHPLDLRWWPFHRHPDPPDRQCGHQHDRTRPLAAPVDEQQGRTHAGCIKHSGHRRRIGYPQIPQRPGMHAR